MTLILENLGKIFRKYINNIKDEISIIRSVRGKGLLNAIVLNCDESSNIPWDICLKMRDNGLLAKPTHGNVIRFAPPLVMTEDQLDDCIRIITSTINEFEPK